MAAVASMPKQAIATQHANVGQDFSSWVQVYNAWKLMLSSGHSVQDRCCGKADCAPDFTDVHSDISTTADGFSRGTTERTNEEAQEEESFDDCLTDSSSSRSTAAGEEEFFDDCLTDFISSSAAAAAEGLAAGRALALLRDLSEAFGAPDFQSELQALLREAAGPDAACSLAGREGLCVAAAHSALSEHGFECTASGLAAALRVLEALAAESEELQEGMWELYDSLGLAPPEARGGRMSAPWGL